MEEKNRSESFDSLKGILIILVVIGHLILGSLSESTTRLVIYYFHMPLFIGITGYFTSTKSLSLSPLDLSKKYWRRMITPYIPAFVIYTAVVAFLQLKTGAWMLSINEGRINDTAAFILYPYYHLWFIPAIVIFVAITKIISYSRLLTAAAVITAFIMTSIYSWNERFFDQYAALDYIGDKRYYCYFFYFIIGHLYARYAPKVSYTALILTLVITAISSAVVDEGPASGAFSVVANISLLILAIQTCKNKALIRPNILSNIGKITLPIYLWHVLPILAAKKLILPMGEVQYYFITSAALLFMVAILLYVRGRFSIIDALIFGESRR